MSGITFTSSFIPQPSALLVKPAYKPHSVALARTSAGDHLSGSAIAGTLSRPTRMCDGTSSSVDQTPGLSSCLALLPVGFAWPATLLPLPVVSYTTVSPSPGTGPRC